MIGNGAGQSAPGLSARLPGRNGCVFPICPAIPSAAMVDDADDGATVRVEQVSPPPLQGPGSVGARTKPRRDDAGPPTPPPLPPPPSVNIAPSLAQAEPALADAARPIADAARPIAAAARPIADAARPIADAARPIADPTATEAAELVTRLLLEPPREV